jgi:hypothetical protein
MFSAAPDLKAMQDEQMDAIRRASTLLPEEMRNMPAAEIYQLALKKRRIASILQKAMTDAGYGDIAKIARFHKVTEEGEQ